MATYCMYIICKREKSCILWVLFSRSCTHVVPCILKRNYHLKYLICYSKCHNVDVFHLKKLLIMLTNGIILVISKRDTLRPLGI